MIPSKFESELLNLRSKERVISFANTIGIHPGIVVGRLQHEGIIPMDWMNNLKESLAPNGMETVTPELEEDVARVGDSPCSESFLEPIKLNFG